MARNSDYQAERRTDLFIFRQYRDVLSVLEAAEALNICKNSVYKLVNDGAISSLRVGKKILIPKLCLIEYIQAACEKDYIGADCSSCTFRKESNHDR